MIPPLEGLVYQTVANLDRPRDSADYDGSLGRIDTLDVTRAQVITSRVVGKRTHKIVLDLDIPAQLIPSSTPGHSHLYIDHEIPWVIYEGLLDALMLAGIIEPGYHAAAIDRGYTAVRLPWVKKADS